MIRVAILSVLPSVVFVGSLLVFIWMDNLFRDPDTQDKVFQTLVLINGILQAPTLYGWGTSFVGWAGTIGLFAHLAAMVAYWRDLPEASFWAIPPAMLSKSACRDCCFPCS